MCIEWIMEITYGLSHVNLPITELVNVLDQSDVVTVNGGQFDVSLQDGMPKVYQPSSEDVDLDLPGHQAQHLSSGYHLDTSAHMHRRIVKIEETAAGKIISMEERD